MKEPAHATNNRSDPKPDAKDDLKSLPLPEVEKKLGSSPDGLSQAEAQKRLTQYGPNEIEEKKTNPLLKFLTYFWGPIPWMIEGAVILSGVVRHWPDFFIILVLLLSNAVVGFWEERQAGNAIAALKAKLAVKAKVKRDGKWTDPAAREVVPGDVIRVRLGDIVPADARLLAGDPVEVDQSALTGESLPAQRKPGEAVFSGSIIRRGEIEAMVYATGANTYFGKTAQLVQEAHTVSHFQRAVLKIGDYLIILAVALVAVIIAVALFRGDPIVATLQFALVLTVAAIPVAMPTVLLAVGARLLAKKEAIVTRLAAIEELAGVDVLCSDKTGTLTQNKLTLGDPFSVNGIPVDQVILCAALASPQGCQVFSFKQPSAEELEHDFLWRTTRRLPERGRIGIFNRSYYEEVLIVRVHPEILRGQGLPDELLDEKTIWQERYRSIADLEEHLHRNGTRIIKIFLHLSKDEQRQRFLERIDEPDKNWKFSQSDIHERKYWSDYMQAYEACLNATSTNHAPWYVVPADDKENARLIVSRIVLDALKGLKMAYPKTTAKRRRELNSIRKRL